MLGLSLCGLLGYSEFHKKKKKVGTGSLETTNAVCLSLCNKIMNKGIDHSEPVSPPKKAVRVRWVGNLFPGLAVWIVLPLQLLSAAWLLCSQGPTFSAGFQLHGEFPSTGPCRAFFGI